MEYKSDYFPNEMKKKRQHHLLTEEINQKLIFTSLEKQIKTIDNKNLYFSDSRMETCDFLKIIDQFSQKSAILKK